MTKRNSSTARPRVKDTRAFIVAATEIHGDRYDYSEVSYVKSILKVNIICKKHGVFEQKPHNHLKGSNCPDCGAESRTDYFASVQKKHSDDFVGRANKEHKNIYDYSLVEYKGSKSKVKIICPSHGAFYQIPSGHLDGKGCPDCGQELYAGWSRSDFVKCATARGDGRAMIYIIKCWSSSEVFYKIGITTQNVKKRFHNKRSMPYKFETIKTVKGMASDVYDAEVLLHRANKRNHYSPKIHFHGSVLECFTEISQDTLFLLDTI